MLDNYTFTLIKNGTGTKYNVSQMVGSVSRRSSEDLLGEEVSFSKSNSLDRYFPKLKFEVGDGFVMNDGTDEIFSGILVDEAQGGLLDFTYTAFDYAFYLNKSTTIIQFNGIRADEALKKLCVKFSVPIGSIANMKTLINKIYKNVTVSDIMKDILLIAEGDLGVKFRMEMDKGKFCVVPYKKMIVEGTFKPASNLAAFDVTKLIGKFTRTRSIADMKNSVIMVSNQENSSSIFAHEKDQVSIDKYGLLEITEVLDDKDISQARNVSKNKLKELNRVGESISIPFLGDDKVKACRILEINDEATGLEGYYFVKDCTHTYAKSIHLMQLTLGDVVESVLSTSDINVLVAKKVATTANKKQNRSVFDDGKNTWR